MPENVSISSPEPFTLNLKWDPGDAQECVFSHWDVQVQGRRFGDLEDRFSRASVTEKWYGEIFDLENHTLNWSPGLTLTLKRRGDLAVRGSVEARRSSPAAWRVDGTWRTATSRGW